MLTENELELIYKAGFRVDGTFRVSEPASRSFSILAVGNSKNSFTGTLQPTTIDVTREVTTLIVLLRG